MYLHDLTKIYGNSTVKSYTLRDNINNCASPDKNVTGPCSNVITHVVLDVNHGERLSVQRREMSNLTACVNDTQ